MNAQCLISFGSNLGNRDSLIAEAARCIDRTACVESLQTSRLFETPPIGGPGGQEPFLNAIAAFDTTASAREILEMLQEIEQQLGRERRRRWDARSIDLDVVLHGELVGGGTGLIVPHPRYTARRFVLEPACDVAAHYRDPRFGWSLQRLASHLNQGTPSLSLVGGSEATRIEICRRLREEHGVQTFYDAPIPEPMTVLGHAPVLDSAESAHDQASIQLTKLEEQCGERWISAFIPPLPSLDSEETGAKHLPRLIARIQSTTAATRWPAPHQMWPAGWRWPEYRLEIDDLDWAISELVSALDSMRCPVQPITEDGNWWK